MRRCSWHAAQARILQSRHELKTWRLLIVRRGTGRSRGFPMVRVSEYFSERSRSVFQVLEKEGLSSTTQKAARAFNWFPSEHGSKHAISPEPRPLVYGSRRAWDPFTCFTTTHATGARRRICHAQPSAWRSPAQTALLPCK